MWGSASFGNDYKKEYTVGFIEWMPYSGIAKDGKPQGISIKLLEEALKGERISVKWRYVSGAEAFLLIRQAKLDAVLDAFMNRNRYHTYSYSNSYALAEYVGVTLRKRNIMDQLTYDDIQKLRICIPTSYFISKEINDNRRNKLVYVKDERDCIQLLERNEADLWLIDKRVGQYYIGLSSRWNLFKFSKVPIVPLPLYLITRKSDNFEFIEAFNRGLEVLRSTGKYDYIVKKELQ